MAQRYGAIKGEYYNDKNKNFNYTTRVIPFTFDENNAKILDLTQKDYELALESIGYSLVNEYGVGMYSQDMMWELLDNPDFIKLAKENDIDAVKVLEDGGESIGVLNTAKVKPYNSIELDERKLSSMAGSSTVEVKQKCRLAGNGNTSTACNQGDINNLNIKPLKEEVKEEVNEEVNPKEMRSDIAAIKSILNGKRGVAFTEINKSIAQKLEKKKIGVIPTRMTSNNTMFAIIYTDKINAYLLYEFAKKNNGYLSDKTPEEAREVGKLLNYSPSDIEQHIRNKYNKKPPLMPDKSPDDYNDLAEDASLDFWDLNEESFPEFEKDIQQDLTTHQLDKKYIRSYQDGEHTYNVYAVNGDEVRDSGFIEWVDGGNHWVDADLPKNEQKYAKHIGENDYWVDDVFMVKPADFEAILLHERIESFIIRHYGYEYDDAHEIANKIEMMFRKKIPEGANRALAEKIYDAFVANFKPKKNLEKHEPANEQVLNENENVIGSLKGELAQAAQKVYDAWEQDEEGYCDSYGNGGICHDIADAMCNILSNHDVECTTVSSDHEVHVYVVAKLEDGIYYVDLPYRYYENGGGYCWKKIPDVEFDERYIVIDRLSADPNDFGQYTMDESKMLNEEKSINKTQKPVSAQVEKALEKARDFFENSIYLKFKKNNVFVEYGLEELEDGDISLFINDIYTDPQYQNKGYATSVLKEICNYADNNNMPISLRASVEGHYKIYTSLTQEQLIKWYQKLGFKLSPNGSKFAGDEVFMIREPESLNENEIILNNINEAKLMMKII